MPQQMKQNNPQTPHQAAINTLVYLVCGVGLIALVAEPNDNSECWLLIFFATKVVAAAAFYAAYVINQYKHKDNH